MREDRFDGLHCSLVIKRPAPALIVIVIRGVDVGELGDAPFRALAPDMATGQLFEIFIDARESRLASLNVSSEWARWLGRHKERFQHVSMLTGSRFIQLTADFVRRFADLGDVMRIYTEAAVFDAALTSALAAASESTPSRQNG